MHLDGISLSSIEFRMHVDHEGADAAASGAGDRERHPLLWGLLEVQNVVRGDCVLCSLNWRDNRLGAHSNQDVLGLYMDKTRSD